MSRYIKKTSLPITLVVLLLAATFIFRGEAQSQKPSSTVGSPSKGSTIPLKPSWETATAFAETDAVRDMPDADVSDNDRVTGDGEEKNPDNVMLANFRRELVASMPRTKQIPSFDAAIIGAPASPSAVGGPLANFDGVAANDGLITINGIVAPSDENMAVGPRDIVQTTNTGFRIWDKAGNPRVGPKPIRTLFSKLGGVCATFESGDPVVQHDRMADRWVISQFNFANANAAPFYECIAVSKTSDPTGSYYTYAFQTVTETPPGTPGVGSRQNFPDYPHLGTWPDGYYMSVNQFDRSRPANNQFNGVGC